MKMKLFFLILLFIIPFGCKEEKEIEVITDYESSLFRWREIRSISRTTIRAGKREQLIDSEYVVYRKK